MKAKMCQMPYRVCDLPYFLEFDRAASEAVS
jgi:hypothetical protein